MKKSARSLPALHLGRFPSLSVHREISLLPPTLFPVSTEDKPTQKIFALETFTALGKMSFVLPLSNSAVWQAGTVFAPTRQPVQGLASILRSVNASVANLILYRSI